MTQMQMILIPEYMSQNPEMSNLAQINQIQIIWIEIIF